jgi:HEAT repeat protein
MRFVLCLWSALILSMQLTAQQSTSLDSKVSVILDRMNRSELHTREAAFQDMMALVHEGQKQPTEPDNASALARFFKQHPEQADGVKVGLIQLLKADNADFVENAAPGTYTENDMAHYAEVINVVSSLNDERAIPVLVNAMATGGMAEQAIFQYGDKALAPVLDQLKSSDPLVQSQALRMSFALLTKRGDPSAEAQIRELIFSYVKAPSGATRRIAIQEIGCLDDRQNFVPLLTEIAKTDPQKLTGRALDGGDGNEFYPVRYDARRVLRSIQNNKPCGP